MARPVAWSYSALSMFENCPRKYHAVKIAKTFSDANKFNMRGDDEHKCFDYYLKGRSPLPATLQKFQPMLDKFRSAKGELYSEFQMALTEAYKPCSFKDWDNAWVRSVADLLIVIGDTAVMTDWKTGKVKDEPDQMQLAAGLIFQHFPAVNTVRSAYMFIHHNATVPYTFTRQQVPDIWGNFLPRVKRLTLAVKTDEWPATPNPLCRFCPVKTCPHNTNPES